MMKQIVSWVRLGVALIDKEMQNFAVFHPKTTIRVSKEGAILLLNNFSIQEMR